VERMDYSRVMVVVVLVHMNIVVVDGEIVVD